MFYSDDKKQYSVLNRRTFFLYLFKVSFFGIVGWRLYDIQIKDSQKYKTLSKNNQIDAEIIYPLRGKIYDINNKILASNIKVFDVYIIPENTKNINKSLSKLNQIIKIDFIDRRKIIELSKNVKKFEKIKVLENINWSELEKIESNKLNIEGIFISQDFMRIYQHKNTVSHLIVFLFILISYILLRKFLIRLSSYQIIITYFLTLIILLIFEHFLAFLLNNLKFNIYSLLNFFLISLFIFIPTIFLFTKLDK